jgi:hypothetical protein
MRKALLFLFSVLCLQCTRAQKKIVFEELRYATPVNYLLNEGLRQQFISAVDSLLFKYRSTRLTDTRQLLMLDLNKATAQNPQRPIDKTDTSTLHLYLTIVELRPNDYFAVVDDPADSLLRKTARTVFRVVVQLLRSDLVFVENETLDVVVNHVKGPGIGNESPLVFMMPKTFLELMRTALNTLLDPAHDIIQLALGVTPAYMLDNYISPIVAGKPRTYVTSQKNVNQYYYADQKQMLRMGEPVYEEIMLRGKKAQRYNDTLVNAIRNTSNYGNSDYVFLRQEWRDVINDKNYLVKLVTQVNPQPTYSSESMFTNFLAGNFHWLISDEDTVASFSILRRQPAIGLNQYPGKVYNGMDTTSVIEVATMMATWQVTYDYILTGDILGHSFKIRCGGVGSKLKEIFLDGRIVCLAQGKFSPEVFVVFDATLPPVLFNQLLIIAFNRFLE